MADCCLSALFGQLAEKLSWSSLAQNGASAISPEMALWRGPRGPRLLMEQSPEAFMDPPPWMSAPQGRLEGSPRTPIAQIWVDPSWSTLAEVGEVG